MPGTAFSTSNWTGYDEQSVTNPGSALTDFTLLIDLSRMSSTWKSNVQSDGADIRVTKGDDTEIPYDLLDWSYSAGPTVTGWLRCKWTGTLAASGTQNVRVWSGYTGGTATGYDANETYGSDNAYDSSWEAYWPLDGSSLSDRTVNNNDLTETGTPPGFTTGKVGGGYETDGTNAEGLNDSGVVIPSDNDVTIMSWVSGLTTSGETTVGELNSSGSELLLRNSSGNPQFILNSFSSNDRVSGSSTIGSGWRHLAGRFDGTDLEVFYQGSLDGTVTPTGSYSQVEQITIGKFGASSGEAAAIHDEVQVHLAARSNDWIAEEYAQSNDQSTFWGTWAWTAASSTSIPVFMHHYLQMRGA